MLNSLHLFGGAYSRFQYTAFTSGWSRGKSSAASLCTECGACEKKCPQSIASREKLKRADAELSVKAALPLFGLLRLVRKVRG